MSGLDLNEKEMDHENPSSRGIYGSNVFRRVMGRVVVHPETLDVTLSSKTEGSRHHPVHPSIPLLSSTLRYVQHKMPGMRRVDFS